MSVNLIKEFHQFQQWRERTMTQMTPLFKNVTFSCMGLSTEVDLFVNDKKIVIFPQVAKELEIRILTAANISGCSPNGKTGFSLSFSNRRPSYNFYFRSCSDKHEALYLIENLLGGDDTLILG